MVNKNTEEFLAICNIKHVKGASLTPRHQGLGERGHQGVMANHLILMNAVCHAFPQEWPVLLPALEFLYDTAPQGVHGLSARDMSCGYALASAVDKTLAPFLVPLGLPESDVAARMFTNFRELYSVFSRATQEQAYRSQLKENHTRYDRTFEPGETVFRRQPRGSRLPKHLFSESSTGPYRVAQQHKPSSIVLLSLIHI